MKERAIDFKSDDYKAGYDISLMECSDWVYELLTDRADELLDKKNVFEDDNLLFKMSGIKGVIDRVFEEIRKQSSSDSYKKGYGIGYEEGYAMCAEEVISGVKKGSIER